MPTQNLTRPFVPAHVPLDSLVLILPLLVGYEMGIFFLGPEAMRNGSDVWLRWVLRHVGFGQYFLLPLLTCCLLLGFHHLGRHRWNVNGEALGKMMTESILFAFILLVLSSAVGHLVCACELSATLSSPNATGRLVSYLGAGVYEELVFRLMMIPFVAWGLRFMGESPVCSWLTAAIVSSLVFAAVHYECFVGCGDVLAVSTFGFRFMAGLCFAFLFVYRGFGSAVVTHALYDLGLYLNA